MRKALISADVLAVVLAGYALYHAMRHGWKSATPVEARIVARFSARKIDREWSEMNRKVKR